MKYLHLATRLFNVPLLISERKAKEMSGVLLRRMAGNGDDLTTSDPQRPRRPFAVTPDGIAMIEVIGPLVKRETGDFISGGPTTYGALESEFMDAATDPSISGILLVVDSPGGEAVGAFELSDMIHSRRLSKPIVAAVDGDAFSAAFALASAAERVFITKSGGVGSVGVWLQHVDFSEWEAKEGIKVTYIFAGARKIDGNPDEPLSAEAAKRFQDEVNGLHQMFVNTIARNRNMTLAAVRETEAMTFSAAAGVEVGFADKVGTVMDAITDLRKMVRAKQAGKSLKKEGSGMKNLEETKAAVPPEEPGVIDVYVQSADAIRAEMMECVIEVVQLCVIAGRSRMIAGFLKAATPIAEVREELQAQRAAEDDPPISTGLLPETGAASDGRSLLLKAADKMVAEAAAR